MKLIEILARELKEWPEHWPAVGQACDGTLHGEPHFGRHIDFRLTRAADYMSAIVTRAEWQAAVDALNKPAAPEWNGEGLPPAKALVEIRNVSSGSEWSEAIIKFAGRNVVVWDWVGEPPINGLCTAYRHAIEIRPVRTPEQIAADERARNILRMQNDASWHANKDLFEKLYDAGYRKQEAT